MHAVKTVALSLALLACTAGSAWACPNDYVKWPQVVGPRPSPAPPIHSVRAVCSNQLDG
jgi:hypothetical protein